MTESAVCKASAKCMACVCAANDSGIRGGTLPGIPAVAGITVAAIATLACGLPSSAQEYVEAQTNAALSAFYGFCLNEMFEIDEVKHLATRLGWKKISETELNAFIPQIEAEIESYEGYLLLSPDEPPLPIAAFVGISSDPDGHTAHCSMFFNDVLPDEFVSAFISDTDATFVQADSKITRRVAFYSVPEFPGNLVLLESQTRGRGLRATFLIREGVD